MTLKQKLFIKKYLEFKGNGTKAALTVYNTSDTNVAAVIASQNMANSRIRRYVEIEFEKFYK